MSEFVPATSVSLGQEPWEVRYAREREEQLNNLVLKREELRIQLLTEALFMDGETKVELTYEGSGDSGGVEECNSENPHVQDLLMTFLSSVEGGWENNDGGRGTITWDLRVDTVMIDHSEYVMETVERSHSFAPAKDEGFDEPMSSETSI